MGLVPPGARMPKMAMRRFCITTPSQSGTVLPPVRKLLHIWPALPLVVVFSDNESQYQDSLDNLVAALDDRDRVREINLMELSRATFERITTVMQQPFLAMRDVFLKSGGGALTVPDTFLNGSAPSLRDLTLTHISFPSLPRLLSSATHLTALRLWNIPNTWYISPESIATSLSTLTNLEALVFQFGSPTPDPKRRRRPRPPTTRTVLPILTSLVFQGVSEWLEVLAARIDAPQLHDIKITFFNQLVLDIPQVAQLIGHVGLSRPSELTLSFYPSLLAQISSSRPQGTSHGQASLQWTILCNALDWQVYSIAQLCTQILPLCSSCGVAQYRKSGRLRHTAGNSAR
jgi:hypothetical protein